MAEERLPASYVLPLRWTRAGAPDEMEKMTSYLQELAGHLEVIVVDGSPDPLFVEHHRLWSTFAAHVAPDADLSFLYGKVNGVLTGVRRAAHDSVVVADDDVRYTRTDLERVVAGLAGADVVRPQNYFSPLPWHARWDTARSLVNRALGGDFPGTLGVRRSTVLAMGGYDGDVLFENLELMRTVEAFGGTVADDPGCFVRRRPPTASHFWGQRVRQAYDEFARPLRMVASLALLPGGLWLAARRRFPLMAACLGAATALAETGRRMAGATRAFPVSCSLLAPAWVAERAVCSWLALGRLAQGGVPYAGVRLTRAATPVNRLRRLVPARPPLSSGPLLSAGSSGSATVPCPPAAGPRGDGAIFRREGRTGWARARRSVTPPAASA